MIGDRDEGRYSLSCTWEVPALLEWLVESREMGGCGELGTGAATSMIPTPTPPERGDADREPPSDPPPNDPLPPACNDE